MRLAYICIFGEKTGSGHLSRALNFQSNIEDEVDIYIDLEDSSDLRVIREYSKTVKPLQELSRDQYDVFLLDTLGELQEEFLGRDKVIVLDSLSKERFAKFMYWSLLYKGERIDPKIANLFFNKPPTNLVVFQGGGDDHKQLELFIKSKKLLNYNLFCGIGNNCRHLDLLEGLILQRGAAHLLLNCNVQSLARVADIVVTSGGHTLLELLSLNVKTSVVGWSKEEKEHLTFSKVGQHENFVKSFDMDEDFENIEAFLLEFYLSQKKGGRKEKIRNIL